MSELQATEPRIAISHGEAAQAVALSQAMDVCANLPSPTPVVTPTPPGFLYLEAADENRDDEVERELGDVDGERFYEDFYGSTR